MRMRCVPDKWSFFVIGMSQKMLITDAIAVVIIPLCNTLQHPSPSLAVGGGVIAKPDPCAIHEVLWLTS